MKQANELGCTRVATLIVAALDTGFRSSELASVRWQHVDLARKEKQRSKVVTPRTANRVGCPRPSVEMMSLMRGLGKIDPAQPIFGPYRYHKSFWKARDKANLGKDACFHTLRHTFISRLVMAGVDLRTV